MRDRHSSFTQQDEVPPEFAPIHQRLLADSQAWERQFPTAEQLNRYAQRLGLQERPPTAARSSPFLRTLNAHFPKGQVSNTMSQTHTRIAIPIFAVLAIVILLGVVFAQISFHNVSGANSTSTKTATPVPYDVNWVHLPLLDSSAEFAANAPTALAPTDPQVVYQTFAHDARAGAPVSNGNATIRRSDDGGKTWHALAFPVTPTHISNAGITVSPVNAHTIFLSIFDTFATTDCPSDRIIKNTENDSFECLLEYYSGDGGAHWKMVQLPYVGGMLITVIADGSRLFALSGCVNSGCTHLIVSNDDGNTWQLADQAINATKEHICLIAAASSKVFAVASTVDCGGDNTQNPRDIWQSNDNGAHWQRNGTLPVPFALSLVAVPNGTMPLLYVVDAPFVAVQIAQVQAEDVRVSADGGKTWTSSPTTGIPAGQKVALGNIEGVLPDGRIVMQSIPLHALSTSSGSTLIAWKQGENWQQIAPAMTQDIGTLLVTSIPQSSQFTLWVVTQDSNSNGTTLATTFAVWKYTA